MAFLEGVCRQHEVGKGVKVERWVGGIGSMKLVKGNHCNKVLIAVIVLLGRV